MAIATWKALGGQTRCSWLIPYEFNPQFINRLPPSNSDDSPLIKPQHCPFLVFLGRIGRPLPWFHSEGAHATTFLAMYQFFFFKKFVLKPSLRYVTTVLDDMLYIHPETHVLRILWLIQKQQLILKVVLVVGRHGVCTCRVHHNQICILIELLTLPLAPLSSSHTGLVTIEDWISNPNPS